MGDVLRQIREFANTCHGTQLRRYVPDPYIVHPERVMLICQEYTDDVCTLTAALLHDVLEDTPVTEEDIREFLKTHFSKSQIDKILDLVVDLTDVYTKENYPKWNRRVRKDKEAMRLSKIGPAAQTIKYADIIDNAAEVTEKDPDFAKRFIPEYRFLLKKMNNGHPELYQRARTLIENCMERLV